MKTTGFRGYAGWVVRLLVLVAAAAVGRNVHAQALPLQITEIMGNPKSFNDDAWEWIEMRNTGATPIDLNGYFIDRLGDPGIPSGSATPSIQQGDPANGMSANTIIPAGGTAVLYDGDISINASDYNDANFRAAWGLAPSVPLIAVGFNFGGGLTNTGNTSLGFWPSYSAYQMDLIDNGMGGMIVGSFNNASVGLDFRTAEPSSFPAYEDGVSIRWNGAGDFHSAANWGLTTTGTTSVPVSISGATNSSQDTGSPGVLQSTAGAPAKLFVTEIMYNPASLPINNIEQWEWIEVYNGGTAINFATTPYVLHDLSTQADVTAANVTTGMIPTGGKAVLYNDAISQADITAAWDPGGARGTLFIPVADFPALAQGGDTIAIWDTLAKYQTDSAASPRVATNATLVQPYNDEAGTFEGTTGTWPSDNGAGSIRLLDLTVDDAGRVNGASWALSTTIDGFSFSAAAVNGSVQIHPGGDLGTPGAFGAPAGPNANFDGTGMVNNLDLAIWKANYPKTTGGTTATGDADVDGDVDGFDFLVWQRQVGTTPGLAVAAGVPEPATSALALVGLVAVAGLRRRSAA